MRLVRFEIVKCSRRPGWPLWAVLIVLLWVTLLAITLWAETQYHRPFPLCPFKIATRLPCPTCGGSRGLLSFFHGDIAKGWRFNPLVFTVLIAWGIRVVVRAITARRLRVHFSPAGKKMAWTIVIILLVCNWIYLIRCVG